MKLLKKISLSLGLSLIILSSFSLGVAAYSGTWRSGTEQDLNGVSQVGTTSRSLGAVYVNLEVYTSNDSLVGRKVTTAGAGNTVEHTCWGQPFLWRYGVVGHSGEHEPWFNV